MSLIADPVTIETLRSCLGMRLDGGLIDEMSMLGAEDSPVFSHPQLNFVQATLLEFFLSDGRVIRIVTSQQDDQWNLLVRERVLGDVPPILGGSIWRRRELKELPTGLIQEVDWAPDLERISLKIGDQLVHLKAGEVYEHMDGQVSVFERDQSVLIFLGDEALEDTLFNQTFSLKPQLAPRT